VDNRENSGNQKKGRGRRFLRTENHSKVALRGVVKQICLRTHGGLGNQLFQVFYARCLQKKYGIEKLYLIHDDNYEHGFQLSESLKIYQNAPAILNCIISKARIPKILERLKLNFSNCFRWKNTMYLDGYFQALKFYNEFEQTVIQDALRELASVFGIEQKAGRLGNLYHIRLRDFFRTPEEETKAALSIVSKIGTEGVIVTNNEPLVRDILREKYGQKHRLNIANTEQMIDVELLSYFSQFSHIMSNGSTFAFWSAVLSSASLEIDNKKLEELYQFLSNFSNDKKCNIITSFRK